MNAPKPGLYRHWKFGKLYRVIGILPDASEIKPDDIPRPPIVLYQALYGDFAFMYRTLDDFNEPVDRTEPRVYKGPRFTPVSGWRPDSLLARLRCAAAGLKSHPSRVEAVSETQEFQADLERLDRESPDWDRDGRLAACESALGRGMGRGILVWIYCEDIVNEAETRRRRT